MTDKPYYCPDCRSNRTKFSYVTTFTQQIMKDAISGTVSMLEEPVQTAEAEPVVMCRVCGFSGNELRFVKQAEREPRAATATTAVYR